MGKSWSADPEYIGKKMHKRRSRVPRQILSRFVPPLPCTWYVFFLFLLLSGKFPARKILLKYVYFLLFFLICFQEKENQRGSSSTIIAALRQVRDPVPAPPFLYLNLPSCVPTSLHPLIHDHRYTATKLPSSIYRLRY